MTLAWIMSDLGSISAAMLAITHASIPCYAASLAAGPIGWVAGGVGCTVFTTGNLYIIYASITDIVNQIGDIE